MSARPPILSILITSLLLAGCPAADAPTGIGAADVGIDASGDAGAPPDASGRSEDVARTPADASNAPDTGPPAPDTSPSGPPEAFLDAPDGTWGTLQFKGLINSAEAVAAAKATQGVGVASFSLDGDTAAVDANLVASRMVIPADYPVLAMRGDDYVAIEGSVPVATTRAGGSYLYFGAGLPVSTLTSIMEGGGREGPLAPYGWFNLYDVEVQLRLDGVALSRYCRRTLVDYDSDASRIWLKLHENADFGPGEALLVWVMADLMPSTPITADNEAFLCNFYIGATAVNAATWRAAASEDPAAIDCPLPDGYMTPPEGDGLILRFVGALNDFDAPTPDPATGLSMAAASVGGEALPIDGYRSMAGRYTDPVSGEGVLYVQTIGGLTELWADDYELLISETTVEVAAARALGDGELLVTNDATSWEAPDGVRFVTLVQRLSEKIRDGVIWYRHCPIAVTDLEAPGSSVLLCHDGAALYAPGDELQLATRQTLTTDPTALALATGVDTPCWCTREDIEIVDCAIFEEL